MLREVRQLVVMGREKRAAAQVAGDVLGDRPGETEPIKRGGAASDLIQDHQRLGIGLWSQGRDRRATGFFNHWTTYSESLQLLGSLALLAMLQYFINGFTISTIYALRTRSPILKFWRDGYLWTWWSFLGSAIATAVTELSPRPAFTVRQLPPAFVLLKTPRPVPA